MTERAIGMLKGLRNFLFGGGGSKNANAELHYIRVYRKPNQPTDTDEIVQVRLDLRNDLSSEPDSDTLFARKAITGPKTFSRTEAMFYYDRERRMVEAEVENGELVSKEDYEAYLAANTSS